ncbi:MAG TPA: ion channel [Ktedonobacterales bacterium]|nr:ion channel [Ktedonobacterales bacterium]
MHVLRIVAAIAAVLLIVVVLWDAFETVVLPRRVSRRFRLARIYTRATWGAWSSLTKRVPSLTRREAVLAIYGPIALLALLVLWVSLLISAYALLLWGLGSPLSVTGSAPARFGTDFYFSGTTFLTLGLGDVIPHAGPARGVVVVEVGTGFGMLALVIGYLPILYQAFSRRETRISLLDAHAGSPPSAGALLLRHPPNRRARRLTGILVAWEDWAAELLETHLSYPLLAYYRSQHEDQSWVAALTMILDTCALVLACGNGLVEEDELAEQAAFTFALARHAAVDLAQVFRTSRTQMVFSDGRLPPAERDRLRDVLERIGVPADARNDSETEGRLDKLRALYEPYMEGLAAYMLMSLPPWAPAPDALDDWQTTADGVTAPSVAELLSHRRTAAPEHAD